MRNLQLSNEKVLSVRNQGIPMRSEDNEETRTEVLGGAAGTSWRAGRASATVRTFVLSTPRNTAGKSGPCVEVS